MSSPTQRGAQAEKSSILNQTQFKAFKAYQKEYPHRLVMLRDAERLVPVVDENDINVPKVKILHEGPPNKALSARYFAEEMSCIFTSEMIQNFDKLN